MQGENQFLSPVPHRNLVLTDSTWELGPSNCPKLQAQLAKAEFTLARLPANLYVCYIHVMCALFSKVLTTVQDLTKDITAAPPEPYLLIKAALLLRFTVSPLQQCF